MSFVRNPKLRAAAVIVLVGALGGAFAWRAEASRDPAPHSQRPAQTAAAAPAAASTAGPNSPRQSRSSSAAPGAPAVALWKAPASVQGTKLDVTLPLDPAAPAEVKAQRGRRAVVDTLSVAAIEQLTAGQEVSLPLLGGEAASGRVNLVQPDDNGWVRVGGNLTGDRKGSFTISTDGQEVAAMVQLPAEKRAYQLSPDSNGQLVLTEARLSEVVCYPMPNDSNASVRSNAASLSAPTPSAAAPVVPILSSRPSATAVLYIDFDGEVVTDPAWANGATINAAPSSLTSAEITQVWQSVKEDYAPFNIDVTTDVSRYNNAPVGKRMRIIVTPTDTAAPGAGGVAYVNSFAQAGRGYFTSTIPGWVFNQSVEGIEEAVAHEAGHTFGLSHDGLSSPAQEYYRGQGSGATSWGPIMGAPYGMAITQWSKGEYANANNHEDDVAIIGNATNGFGFVADEAGGNAASAASLSVSNGAVNQSGIVTQASDVDWFKFTTSGGAISLQANPAAYRPDLDISLQIFDSGGNVVTQVNPDQPFNASVSLNLNPGTYYATVQGVGHGNPATDGYSNYGSLGSYTLTGSIPNSATPPPPPPPPADQQPVITSPTTATGTTGAAFSYQITATNGVYQYDVTGTLPAGLRVNKSTGVISGTPSGAGTYTVGIWAANATLVDHTNLTITISQGAAQVDPQPVITSSTWVSGTTGAAFSYQITASGGVYEYDVTGSLPPGVAVNKSTGLISGTPTAAGTYWIRVWAANATKVGYADVTIGIN